MDGYCIWHSRNYIKPVSSNSCIGCEVRVVYTIGKDGKNMAFEDFPQKCPYFTRSREEAWNAVREWKAEEGYRQQNLKKAKMELNEKRKDDLRI